MPSDAPKVFQFIFDGVLPTLHTFIATTSSNMASIAGAVGGTLFAIYVMLWGIAILRGSVQEPLSDGFFRIIRGVAILAFATSAGVYSSYVVEFFTSVPASIASEIAEAGSSGDFVMGDNMATAHMLDVALGNGLKAGKVAWDSAAGIDLTAAVAYGLLAIVIWLFVALVCAYAGALVLVANMGLSIMLGIGPLFILCAIFESTQQLFVSWTRQLITFGVFFIILSAAITLTFSFFNPFLNLVANSSGKGEVILIFVKLVCFCSAALVVLWQSVSWASGLAGGVAVSSAGAIGRMVGTATQTAKAGAHGMAHKHYDPLKKNQDGSRGGHRWAGAIPTTIQAMRGVANKAHEGSAKGAAYMRRNTVSKS